MKIFDITRLNQALQMLNEQLELRNFPLTEIVVCGGSALIAAAKRVGDILQLPEDWLNNGPASQFDMGLTEMLKQNGGNNVCERL